jgi:hypothetical protein
MNHHRSFPRIIAVAAAAAVAVVALGGCGQGGGRTSARSPAPASRTSASGPISAVTGASAVPGVPTPSSPPAGTATTSPAVTVAPTVASGHHSVATTATTRPSTTTSPAAAPSGPPPAAPGTYTYHQVGSLPGTPAEGTLVVAPVSASGTQVWTRAVGGTLAPAASVMLFDTTGAYLVSPGDQVAGAGASCTFAAPVPWPSWPTTTGRSFSAPAACTGGVSSYLMTGKVEGTTTVSLNGQSVVAAVVVNTITVKGSVDGDSFNVTMTETDDFAPNLRVPVVTRAQVKGTAIGIPISTTRTDTLVSATPS